MFLFFFANTNWKWCSRQQGKLFVFFGGNRELDNFWTNILHPPKNHPLLPEKKSEENANIFSFGKQPLSFQQQKEILTLQLNPFVFSLFPFFDTLASHWNVMFFIKNPPNPFSEKTKNTRRFVSFSSIQNFFFPSKLHREQKNKRTRKKNLFFVTTISAHYFFAKKKSCHQHVEIVSQESEDIGEVEEVEEVAETQSLV